ncbi:hypothetical protein AB9_091 [Acinetobacter phage vB_AbaM_B9]|nr:hypothetical protein AB9_091 [Acinetobacter phage vB_AbaM_B9]
MTKKIKIGVLELDMGDSSGKNDLSDAIYVNTKNQQQLATAFQFATYQAIFEKKRGVK